MTTFAPTPQYYETLGRLVIEMAGIERIIIGCIRICCSVKTRDELVSLVGGDSLDALCKKLEKIVKTNLRDEAILLEQFEPILGSLKEIKEKRNQYLHSLWSSALLMDAVLGAGPTLVREKFLLTYSHKKGLEDIEFIPLEELKKFTDGVSKFGERLLAFFIGNDDVIQAAIHRRIEEQI